MVVALLHKSTSVPYVPVLTVVISVVYRYGRNSLSIGGGRDGPQAEKLCAAAALNLKRPGAPSTLTEVPVAPPLSLAVALEPELSAGPGVPRAVTVGLLLLLLVVCCSMLYIANSVLKKN